MRVSIRNFSRWYLRITLLVSLVVLPLIAFSIWKINEINDLRNIALDWNLSTTNLEVLSNEYLNNKIDIRLKRWQTHYTGMQQQLDEFLQFSEQHPEIFILEDLFNKLPDKLKDLANLEPNNVNSSLIRLNFDAGMKRMTIISANLLKYISEEEARQFTFLLGILVFVMFSLFVSAIAIQRILVKWIETPIHNIIHDVDILGKEGLEHHIRSSDVIELNTITNAIEAARKI